MLYCYSQNLKSKLQLNLDELSEDLSSVNKLEIPLIRFCDFTQDCLLVYLKGL